MILVHPHNPRLYFKICLRVDKPFPGANKIPVIAPIASPASIPITTLPVLIIEFCIKPHNN